MSEFRERRGGISRKSRRGVRTRVARLLGSVPFAMVGLIYARLAGAQTARSADSTFAIVGATVIDVKTGGHLTNAAIIVRGGRIVSVDVSAGKKVVAGQRVIDAKGKFVIPGLWDMHVEEALPVWDRLPVDSNAKLFFPLLLSYGVTGVRDVAGAMDVTRRWRDEIERGTRIGPRIVYSGPKLGTKPVAAGAPFPLKGTGDASASMQALAAGGASGVYLMQLDESLLGEVVRKARTSKLHVGGNLPPKIMLQSAIDSGINALDHLDGLLAASTRDRVDVMKELRLAEERPLWARLLWKLGLKSAVDDPREYVLAHWSAPHADSLFKQLAQHRVYQIATLRLYGTLLGSGDSLVRLPAAPMELRPPPRSSRGWSIEPYPTSHPSARTYQKMLWSVNAMQHAGVPILAASDTPNLFAAPGSSLHDELGLMVRAGLSPLDAIRTATIRPAEFLAATDSLGTVAAGKVADFLVLDADPTVDIANTRRISMVVARGKTFDRRALDAMREQGATMAREIEAYWIARDRKGK